MPPEAPAEMPESLLNALHGIDLSDEEHEYPEFLTLHTFDTDHFHILPLLVLFAARSGVDPSWLRHCKSKKMMCMTTPDGWMDEKSKLAWYKAARKARCSPLADRERRVLHQVDQHYSNETIELSALLEEDNNIGLNTPGHHTAAL